MSNYSHSHLSDPVLLCNLSALAARERTTLAALLAHIAEVEVRRLYVPAACPSMYVYCVRELGLSEQAALKRLYAARTARQFPAIFPALADGRLHLSAVGLLAPHLTPQNADELLAAAAHRSKSEIEEMLAARFPRSGVFSWVEDLVVQPSPAAPTDELSPGRVGGQEAGASANAQDHDPEVSRKVRTDAPQLSPGRVETLGQGSKVNPLGHQQFALQVMIGQETREKLRHAKELLSHELPSGDEAQVLDRALDQLIAHLEKRKFAATARPRRSRRASASKRHIPAHVKRAVWKRDSCRCTFVSEAGRRCSARTRLELDHIDPVARGGRATVENMRLRCRAHNQYEAERAFGTAFMEAKRQEARRAKEEARRVGVERRAAAEAKAAAEAERAKERDVVPWLRQLGFRPDEARCAAAHCETIPDASLEERVRVALSSMAPPHRRTAAPH